MRGFDVLKDGSIPVLSNHVIVATSLYLCPKLSTLMFVNVIGRTDKKVQTHCVVRLWLVVQLH